jgi:hypothetical protein
LGGAAVVLPLIVFLAYFSRFREFGFYGDDASFFARAIIEGWANQWAYLGHVLVAWPQGRPLGYGLALGLVPHAAFAIGGLAGLHFISFVIQATNVVVLYRLIARFFPAWVAFCAGAFLGLSPVDTVKESLAYGYCFQLAILAALVATHAALDKKTWLFVLMLATALMTMEPVIMIPLALPLVFTFRPGREWIRAATRHAAIWLLVLIVVLICRAVGNTHEDDGRVGQMLSSPLLTLQRAATTAFTGPRTQLELWWHRLLQPLHELDGQLVLLMATVLLLSSVAFYRQVKAGRFPSDRGSSSPSTALSPSKLIVAGILLLLATYACYFRAPWYPGTSRHGFLSGVHVIPAVGAALALSGLFHLLANLATPPLRGVVLAVSAMFITLLAGFGNLVQRDYATSWQFQQEFWKAYSVLCTDASDRTFVLVLDHNLPRLRYVEPSSWCTEVLPGALYYYRTEPNMGRGNAISRIQAGPGSWVQVPPSVIFTAPDLVTTIKYANGAYAWKPSPYYLLKKTAEEQPRSGNVIVLSFEDGRWSRYSGNAPVDGGYLRLRDPGANLLEKIPKTPLAGVFGL